VPHSDNHDVAFKYNTPVTIIHDPTLFGPGTMQGLSGHVTATKTIHLPDRAPVTLYRVKCDHQRDAMGFRRSWWFLSSELEHDMISNRQMR